MVREQVMSEAPGPAAELEDGYSGRKIEMRDQLACSAIFVECLSILVLADAVVGPTCFGRRQRFHGGSAKPSAIYREAKEKLALDRIGVIA